MLLKVFILLLYFQILPNIMELIYFYQLYLLWHLLQLGILLFINVHFLKHKTLHFVPNYLIYLHQHLKIQFFTLLIDVLIVRYNIKKSNHFYLSN